MKNTISFLILLIATVATFNIVGCSHFVDNRKPDSVQNINVARKPIHHIITLHGVRGNKESFGDFHKYVGNVLGKINNSYEYQVHNWFYPVGSSVDIGPDGKESKQYWNPHRIAKLLNDEIFLCKPLRKELSETGFNCIENLGENDIVSFAAYSMGGQMIMTWFYDTYFNFRFHEDLKFNDSEFSVLKTALQRTKNIIGLGPVYWGSIESELGHSMFKLKSKEKIQPSVNALDKFCQSSIVSNEFVKDSTIRSEILKGIKGNVEQLVGSATSPKQSSDQKNLETTKNILIWGCRSIYHIKNDILEKKSAWGSVVSNITNNLVIDSNDAISDSIIEPIKSGLSKFGNTNVLEVENMALTSDVIRELRINSIEYMNDVMYLNHNNSTDKRIFPKWTNIIGVFPCLGKKDKERLTCEDNQFYDAQNDKFFKLKNQLLDVFQGINRRETDGPVMSPGATSDFIFYSEKNFNQNVTANQYLNSSKILDSENIYTENLHATLVPGLESVTGVAGNFAKNLAEGIVEFDSSLKEDVAIMNSCDVPETCKHPNFKLVINTLSGCQEPNANCDLETLNKYFNLENNKSNEDRLKLNSDLSKEMGSLAVVLNLRVPKDYKLQDTSTEGILKYIQFGKLKNNIFLPAKRNNFLNPGKFFEDSRLDENTDKFSLQLGRKDQLMSRHAYLKEYQDQKHIKVVLLGRVWSKIGGSKTKKINYPNEVTIGFDLKLPGLKARQLEAVVQAGKTTFIDLSMPIIK